MFLHAASEDSDKTGRMPRLIWVFAEPTCHFVGFVMRRQTQMKQGEKFQIFIPRIWCFWYLSSSSSRMHRVSIGRLLPIFFSVSNLRRFHTKWAQRYRVIRQFSKSSKWKLQTSAETETHLIPYNFNSNGDNLEQVEIQIELEAVWCEFLTK